MGLSREDVFFSRKEFLNKGGLENMANIVAHITKNPWIGNKKDIEREVDIHLSIADCERKITLSFDMDTEYERENSLYKVQTLIDVLTEFKSALDSECIIQALREKQLKELEVKE